MDILDDTHPKIRKMQIEGYRRMTPQQKMRYVTDLINAARQMAAMRIRQQYGEMSERELQLRLGALWLDRETMIRVFDWDPKEKGYYTAMCIQCEDVWHISWLMSRPTARFRAIIR